MEGILERLKQKNSKVIVMPFARFWSFVALDFVRIIVIVGILV